MPITLVLGGARSGKSAFAQKRAEMLAESNPRARLVFIATAEAGDDEMRERIERHRADRDARWRTLEAPRRLAAKIQSLDELDIAVVDCLTLWLSNALLAEQDLAEETRRLLIDLVSCPAHLFVVSNEVGLGIVPDNVLAREFRDAAGRLHQQIAERADTVIFVAAGLALTLKGG